MNQEKYSNPGAPMTYRRDDDAPWYVRWTFWFPIFGTAFILGWMLNAAINPAQATELGVKETRGWSYCYEMEYAVQIGDLYFDAGYEIAVSAWERAMELDDCNYRTATMTPLETVWSRTDGVDTISVVRTTHDSGGDVFWFRLERNR